MFYVCKHRTIPYWSYGTEGGLPFGRNEDFQWKNFRVLTGVDSNLTHTITSKWNERIRTTINLVSYLARTSPCGSSFTAQVT